MKSIRLLQINKSKLINKTNKDGKTTLTQIYQSLQSFSSSSLQKQEKQEKPKQPQSQGVSPFHILNEDLSGHNIRKLKEDTNFDMSGTAKEVLETFTNSVLPKIENFVERQILDEFSEQLSPVEKETVKDAYGLRREKADRTQVKKEVAEFTESSLTPEEFIKAKDIILNYNEKTVPQVRDADVGKVYALTNDEQRLVFPFDCYGLEFKENAVMSSKVGIMVRNQGVLITKYLSYIKTPKEREQHFRELFFELVESKKTNTDSNKSLSEMLSHSFLSYSVVYQHISESLNDYLYYHTNSSEKIRLLFSANDIFEGLVRKIMTNMEDPVFAVSFVFLKSVRESIIDRLVTVMFDRFGIKVGLDSFELSELDHRISENDLITVKYFHQVTRVLESIDLKIDFSQYIAEIDTLKKENKQINLIKSEELFSNNNDNKTQEALLYNTIQLSQQSPQKSLNFTFKVNKPDLVCKEKDLQIQPKKKNQITRRVSYFSEQPRTHKPLFKLDTLETANIHAEILKSAWFNSSLLLYGDTGVGKSGILNYIHIWAKSNNWFVVPVFRATRMYSQLSEEVETHVNGLLLTYKAAKEFLLELKLINLEILAKITNIPDYGKFNYAGERDGSLDSFPVLWDERREVFTDAWKQFPFAESKEEIAKRFPDHYKRISDYIPKPKNLLEIVDFGLDNPRFSHNAIAEVLDAVKKSKDYKSVTLIDEYNEMFKPCHFYSYRFANYNKLQTPPHAFALIRQLINFDGHLSYNGVKICATSTKKYYRHECPPKKLNLPEYLSMKVDNLNLNECRNIINYYNLISRMRHKELKENDVLYIYNLSQGNFSEIVKACVCPPLSQLPSYSRFLERKKFLWSLKPKDLESIKKSKDARRAKESKRIESLEESRKNYNKLDYYL